MSIPLEDLFNDVLGKSRRGLGLTEDALSARTGVSVADIKAAMAGEVDEVVLTKLAPALKLDATSLVTMANKAWAPEPVSLTGLAQFNTDFGDMTVNAYIVYDPATKAAAAFDTGATAKPMVDFIKENGLSLNLVFLTHTHGDHVADLSGLCQAGAPTVFVNAKEPFSGAQTFEVGDTTAWELGGLKIEPRNTSGHSKGGTTYVITGLEKTVAVVGDALFASSMGGGMVSFTDALATNRKEVFSLPDDTVVCPGHGPLTTIAEEKVHNPFYPEFKA
ncbi:MAG: fold metallo-hydrolase [Verrucomicrobiaceae bacterium]|nr:fold metallo-hydrolase [Verrucomicrobiaceae bacterium]